VAKHFADRRNQSIDDLDRVLALPDQDEPFSELDACRREFRVGLITQRLTCSSRGLVAQTARARLRADEAFRLDNALVQRSQSAPVSSRASSGSSKQARLRRADHGDDRLVVVDQHTDDRLGHHPHVLALVSSSSSSSPEGLAA